MAEILHEIDEAQKAEIIRRAETVWWAVGTCWWTTDPRNLYEKIQADGLVDGNERVGRGLPCDPRGSVLMMTDDVAGFIRAAEENVTHYGRHGLRAFWSAYHGVLVAPNGNPTSLEKWDGYNCALDRRDAGDAG